MVSVGIVLVAVVVFLMYLTVFLLLVLFLLVFLVVVNLLVFMFLVLFAIVNQECEQKNRTFNMFFHGFELSSLHSAEPMTNQASTYYSRFF